MRWAERWFGVLLRLLPRAFRDRHGQAMRDTFAGAYTAHRTRGLLSASAFMARTTVDVAASALRERLSPRHRRRGSLAQRAASRGAWIPWLDLKLGLRMLRKHPGLTLVSTFALAVGIPVGLAPDHMVGGLTAPLPVPEGAQIHSLRLWDPASGQATETTTADLESWQGALPAFQGLGAFRREAFNLDAGGPGGTPVRGAEVTASTFPVLEVRPLMGRWLRLEDETPGAEDVVLLGFDLWHSRYGGDPGIVGREIRLGGRPTTVVGVMPEGFLFPVHELLWVPFRSQASASPASAMAVSIFGRLDDGISVTEAQSQFALVAAQTAPPGRDPRIAPHVGAFADFVMPGLSGALEATPEVRTMRTLAWILLLVACANVAMLVFARTAARAGELSVRTALGASRARIVAQVFVECLVLAVVASAAGLLLFGTVLHFMGRLMPPAWSSASPYWIRWDIGAATALRALALAGVSAAVAGALPAVRFTGGRVQANLRRARAARTGLRFGGLSSALIVADVAVAVTALGFALAAWTQVRDAGASDELVGIRASEYLAAALRFSPSGGDGASSKSDAARRAASQEELVRRLREEPEVRSVAVADALPRMQQNTTLVEVEGLPSPENHRGFNVRVARVSVDYFDALDQTVRSGRDFTTGDVADGGAAVIVNETFVKNVLGDHNPLGQRIRFLPWGDGRPGPWKEIVGVVGHLGMRTIGADLDQGVYEPVAAGALDPVQLGIHLGGDPVAFAGRLRRLASQVDPSMVVSVTGRLDGVFEGDWYLLIAIIAGAGLLVGVLLALAASGTYALMSFAVTQRTTEIGIRTALGAARYDLVVSLGRRAAIQLGLGVLIGMPCAAVFVFQNQPSMLAGAGRAAGIAAAVLVVVGLAACTGPTLRALRVHPSDALRADGGVR